MKDSAEHTYETKVGTTLFIVTAKFEGSQTFEELLKYALKRKINYNISEMINEKNR
jgi:hypothetical protein